jgi:hypothetical protein
MSFDSGKVRMCTSLFSKGLRNNRSAHRQKIKRAMERKKLAKERMQSKNFGSEYDTSFQYSDTEK